jgi:type IV secretory pathway protease TraF
MIALHKTRVVAASFAIALAAVFVPAATPADTVGDAIAPLGGTIVAAHKHCHWIWRHHHQVRVCRWY